MYRTQRSASTLNNRPTWCLLSKYWPLLIWGCHSLNYRLYRQNFVRTSVGEQGSCTRKLLCSKMFSCLCPFLFCLIDFRVHSVSLYVCLVTYMSFPCVSDGWPLATSLRMFRLTDLYRYLWSDDLVWRPFIHMCTIPFYIYKGTKAYPVSKNPMARFHSYFCIIFAIKFCDRLQRRRHKGQQKRKQNVWNVYKTCWFVI